MPPVVPDSAVPGIGAGPVPEQPTLPHRVKTLLIGRPRDLSDQSILHHLSLVAFLAWVGLGADGLSSSCYGPAEAFQNLGAHTYLALFLAVATIVTVFIISACYSHIIEEFPSGGGGYLVASKLLSPQLGVVSGCALLVDYVLTITTSTAAAGNALFGLLGPAYQPWKLGAEFAVIGFLILLNLRGVKESVMMLVPIFLLFLATHALVISGAIAVNLTEAARVTQEITEQARADLAAPGFGFWGMLTVFLYAYSLGAGTYTGIEAVSNSMPVMREPRVETGKRTMRYMAFSLAFTAGGLVVAYLLMGMRPSGEKTMNQVLTESFVSEIGLDGLWTGHPFVLVTMISEGALLVVAAQAGFIDGPRVLATMARDSWVPHWFGNLSERLAAHNGVLLMGGSALVALGFTRGDVSTLLVMYSINVFVTFSLSMIGMCRHWWRVRGENPLWRRRLTLFGAGATLCVMILLVTVTEKFQVGGWRTLAVTGLCVGLCLLIRRYYARVNAKLRRLDEDLGRLPAPGPPNMAELDPSEPAAVILVGGYSGLGIHTLLNALRFAPGGFRNVVFISVGVVDSGTFKGVRAVDDLRKHTEESLGQYVDLARRHGLAATSFMAIGTDVVDELEHLCVAVKKRFPRAIFFAGQLVFQKDTWYQRLLHNETAYSLQRRLHWNNVPMVILPTRVLA